MPKGIPGRPLCSVEGCEQRHNSHGLCGMHSQRLRRTGKVPEFAGPLRFADPIEALRAKTVIDPSGCHLWGRRLDKGGYGLILAHGKLRKAHRFAYEVVHGPVPKGLVLDHMCHNEAVARGECAGGPTCRHRRCVNVAHVIPALQRDNARRGLTGAHNGSKTHCSKGHPFSGANLIPRADGARGCRECQRAGGRKYAASPEGKEHIRAYDAARYARIRESRVIAG